MFHYFLKDVIDRIPNENSNIHTLQKTCQLNKLEQEEIKYIPFYSRKRRILILEKYIVRAAMHHNFPFLTYARNNGCDISKVLYFILFFLDYNHSNSEPYIAWLFSNIKKLYHVDEVNNLEVEETTWKGFILEWLCIRNGNKKLIHTLLTIKYLNINQIINKRNILLSIAMSIDKNNINRNNRKMIFILKYLITQSNIDLEYVDMNGDSFLDIWKKNTYLLVEKPYDFYHIKHLYEMKLYQRKRKVQIRSLLLLYQRKSFLGEDICREILTYL